MTGRRRRSRNPYPASNRGKRGANNTMSLPTRNNLVFNKAFTRKFHVDKGTVTTAELTQSFGQITFSLSDIAKYMSFSNVFDYYTINQVFVQFKSLQKSTTDVQDSSNPNQRPPTFAICVDTNSTTLPTSMTTILGYHNAKMTIGDRDISIRFKPLANLIVYAGVSTVGYVANSNPLRTTDYGVPHYGVFWGFDVPTGSDVPPGAYVYEVLVTYDITFFTAK